MERLLLTLLFTLMTGMAVTAQRAAPALHQLIPKDADFRAYIVRLYLVQKLPVVNPSLLPWQAAVVYHKYPTSWSEIELLVSVPEFARRRGYRICKDCPLEVLPIYALD